MVYERPEESDLLKEYTKAIPHLTISKEQRLQEELDKAKSDAATIEALQKGQQAFGKILLSAITQMNSQAKPGASTISLPIELFEDAGLNSDVLTVDKEAKKRHIEKFKKWKTKQ